MDDTRWNRLSSWHNRWLAADAGARRQIEAELREADPDLIESFTDLASASPSLDGFLETPAFVAAARRMARDLPRLTAGATVGPYRIGELVARGGMGTVYRAHDARLNRDVAVKVLSPVDAASEGSLDRFLREARLTAAIDHPNVVRLYDVGVIDGQPYLVMEWLDGSTLRARLAGQTMTTREIRRLASDVARGLGAAHAAGLVHRDLKPENILITRDGSARIVDFGIAKLLPGGAEGGASNHTVTSFLVGTAGYLAPEQIRGEPVDARADLFALGAILFEALTGTRAFTGTSTVDTLHATLHAPVPTAPVRTRDTAPDLLAIAHRLLEKSPGDRFQSATDLLWALEHGDDVPQRARSRRPARSPRRVAIVRGAVAAAAVLAAAGGAWWWTETRSTDPSLPLTRFSWSLPEGTGLRSAPVVSPDGRRVAWAATDQSNRLHVYVRDLSADTATMVAGTEGARQPFWSPTSASIGFFADGKLKTVALGGGTPAVLADAPDPRGGAWSRRGFIVFQPLYRDSRLLRVADDGGPVEPASTLLPGEVGHIWPSILPDGDHVLFSVISPDPTRTGPFIGRPSDLSRTTTSPLIASTSSAAHVAARGAAAGWIVSVAHARVEVRRFDAERLQIGTEATMLSVPSIPTSPHHASLVSASPDVLVTSRAGIPWGAHMARARVDGRDLTIDTERMLGGFPRVSPDGSRLSLTRVDVARYGPSIWIDDLMRGTRLRLTGAENFNVVPAWSPDGLQVAFRTGSLTNPAIGVAAADGSGVVATIACPVSPCEPSDWMPDGRSLLITVRNSDVWRLPLDAGAPPEPILGQAFVERDARVSPDGRWLAYVSDESGRNEVYVQPLTGPPSRHVVSAGGGDQPVWDRSGRALYFVNPAGRLTRTDVRLTSGTVDIGASSILNLPRFGERHWGTTYDVGPDGVVHFQHFTSEEPPRELQVMLGWQELLRDF